jgi:hypothetical protein
MNDWHAVSLRSRSVTCVCDWLAPRQQLVKHGFGMLESGCNASRRAARRDTLDSNVLKPLGDVSTWDSNVLKLLGDVST